MISKRQIGIHLLSAGILALIFIPIFSHGAGLVDCKGKFGQCDFGDVVETTNKIINWIIAIAVSVSAIMFAYAGFLYMTAQGDLSQMKRGRDIFTNVVIGFAIMLSAWLIIKLIVTTLSDGADNTKFTNLINKIFGK